MDLTGQYNLEQFPPNRRFIIDTLNAGVNKHVIYGLLDFDITLARRQIKEFRRSSPVSIDFFDKSSAIKLCLG